MINAIPELTYPSRANAEIQVGLIVRLCMRLEGLQPEGNKTFQLFTPANNENVVRYLVVNQLMKYGCYESQAETIFSTLRGDLFAKTRMDIVKLNHHLGELELAIATANALIRYLNEDR